MGTAGASEKGPACNSPEWWESKGRRYIKAVDSRDRPYEFKNCAAVVLSPVLEVGCAFGNFSKYLRSETQYLGVELTQVMADVGKRKFPKRAFLQGDIWQLAPGFRNSFMSVCAFQFLEHWKDPLNIMKRLMAMSKKRVIITVPRGLPNEVVKVVDGHVVGWRNEQEVERLLHGLGSVHFFQGADNHICFYVDRVVPRK